MSSLSDFLGGGGASPPTTLFSKVNKMDAGRDVGLLASYFGFATSSVTTTGTYADIVNVSGAGILTYMLVGVDGTASNDLDFKVIIDGTTVLTQEGNTTSTSQAYAVIGGVFWERVTNGGTGQTSYDSREPITVSTGSIPFSSSFVVQVKSASAASLAAQIAYDYYLTS